MDIDYDTSLITDEIFNLTDITKITITGPEKNIGKVRQEIQNYLYNMKMITIHLMNTDYSYVKQSICNLKTAIDPADARLRKKDPKSEREIKHSFYYIPSNSRDLVIIGFDSEVKKGQAIIRDFLLRQNTLEHNQSLCFLCPTYLMNTISTFKNDYSELLRIKNIHFIIIEPNYIRKHLNIHLEGKWKDIMLVKNYLFRCFRDFYNSSAFLNFNTSHLASINFIPNKKKSSIYDFLQYTYNQEHKLISKNLRKFFIEKNHLLKNWDYLSEELFLNEKYLAEVKSTVSLLGGASATGQIKKEDFNNSFSLNNFNNNINNTPNTIYSSNIKDNQDKEDESNNNQLKTFLTTYDRDTALNYLLNQFPGDYQRYYGMSQIDLCDHLIFYLEEANNSYNHFRKDNESERNSNPNPSSSGNINFTKFTEKENKNDENKSLFTDPSDVLASEYEPNSISKEHKKPSIKKRRKSRSTSRGNYSREKDYRVRDHRERDNYYRDRERDYRDKDYRERDFKDAQQASKTIDYEPEYQFSDEVCIPNKENKSFTKKTNFDVNNKSDPDLYLLKKCNSEIYNNNDEIDHFRKFLAGGDFNKKTSLPDNPLLKKISLNLSNPKEKNKFTQEDSLNPNKIPVDLNENNHQDNKFMINSNSNKSFEIENQNMIPMNLNSMRKSKSFVINKITANAEEEENIELKNSLNAENEVNDTKVGVARLKIGNLKTIDISMDGSAQDENFLNKIGNLTSLKNGTIGEIHNSFEFSNINEGLINKKNTSNISNFGSSAEKDSLCNENFITHASNIPNSNNNNTAVNTSEMMNVLYNFSNINQMNINININSNYKDLLLKPGESENLFASNKELEFLKNLESFRFMNAFNSSMAYNINKNPNNYINMDIPNNFNEKCLNFEPNQNEITLLKRKIKSSEFNSSKTETSLIIDQTLIEKKSTKEFMNNFNPCNIDPDVLNLNEKINGRESSVTNLNLFDKNNKTNENLNSSRRLDSSKNEKNSDKYYDRYSAKYQEKSESNSYNLQSKGNLRSSKNTRNANENRKRRSSSKKSKNASASISPENYIQNTQKNFSRKDSASNDSHIVSDNSSSKRKDNQRENSVGNYVYKRRKIKIRRQSKKEINNGLATIPSESSSPNLSLNGKNSNSLSKKSNKSSINKNKYGGYYPNSTSIPNRKSEKFSKEISNNSGSDNTQNKIDLDRKYQTKLSSKVDNFILDVKMGLNRSLYESRDENLNNLNKKFFSKQQCDDYMQKKDSESKSKSISKNASNPCSKSLSMEKEDYNDNLRNKIYNQGNSNILVSSLGHNNIYERRRKLFENNYHEKNNINDFQISSSNKSNYYGKYI